MCQRQATLRHHLYQVTQAQFEAKVPAHAQNNDIAVATYAISASVCRALCAAL
jgi:hypothetical protein